MAGKSADLAVTKPNFLTLKRLTLPIIEIAFGAYMTGLLTGASLNTTTGQAAPAFGLNLNFYVAIIVVAVANAESVVHASSVPWVSRPPRDM